MSLQDRLREVLSGDLALATPQLWEFVRVVVDLAGEWREYRGGTQFRLSDRPLRGKILRIRVHPRLDSKQLGVGDRLGVHRIV